MHRSEARAHARAGTCTELATFALVALALIGGSHASGWIVLASLSDHPHRIAVTAHAGGFDLVLEHERDGHHEPGAVELHGSSCDPGAHSICLARSDDPGLAAPPSSVPPPPPAIAIDSSLGCHSRAIACAPRTAPAVSASALRQRASVVLLI